MYLTSHHFGLFSKYPQVTQQNYLRHSGEKAKGLVGQVSLPLHYHTLAVAVSLYGLMAGGTSRQNKTRERADTILHYNPQA